ncbi:MAG: hypothetical protein HOK28_05975, partial [Deltaproteobacteria bacterium]|nr:hypothetical protein [Deltaproteobacteria bacterium]
MRPLKTVISIVLALFICLPASAFAADSKLVVIPMNEAGSARMTKALLKHVITPLGAKQSLVPYGQYRRSAKKAKVKLTKLAEKSAVEKVAKSMGITHLVTVHVKADTVQAKLIDAGTLKATQSWDIPGQLAAKTGQALVTKIGEGLKPAPAPVVAAATAAPAA